MKTQLFTSLLCSLMFFTAGWAQDPGPAPTPVPHFECSFYITSQTRPENIHYGVFDDDGKMVASEHLKFKTSGRSDRYTYKGPSPLIFFAEEPNPLPGQPDLVRRIPVGSVSLDANPKDLLLLFRKSNAEDETGLPYSIQGVDLSSDAIPDGHLGILNLTSVRLKGVLGRGNDYRSDGTAFDLQPGMNDAVEIYPKGELILALDSKEHGPLNIFQRKFYSQEDEKYLLIIFPPTVRGSINVGGVVIPFPSNDEEDPEDSEEPEEQNS